MQLLSSLEKVFVVLKDKVAIDLNKNVEQNIIQLKLLIIYHFRIISCAITGFIKFGVQIVNIFIQLLENMITLERKLITNLLI